MQFLYEGLPQGMAVPWSAWALTLAVWMPFMAALYWVVLCLAVLLRGQWIDNERLLFPLTSLPLAMTQDPGRSSSLFSPLLRSRLMWLGFAVPLLLHSWNSLAAYHDGIQPLALTGSFSLLQGQVWVPFRLNLPIIGVGYLMSLGVSFSVWFFFVLGLVQTWVFTRVGLEIGAGDVWNSGGGPAAIMHQQAGALVVLVGFVLWTARRHLAGLVRRALDNKGGGEVMAPRTALLGLPAGVAVVVAWLVLTGLSLFVAVVLVLGALIVYIGVARVICEAGLPGVQTPMVPQAFITRGFGPGVLGLGNMTGLGLSTVWVGAGGLTTMTSAMLHTFKLKATAGERPDRRLPWIFLAAIVVGMAGSIWVTMGISYAHGGVNLHGWFFEGAPRWPLTYMALRVPRSGALLLSADALHRDRGRFHGAAPVSAPAPSLVAPSPHRLSHRHHLSHRLLRLVRPLPGLGLQGAGPAPRRGADLPVSSALLPRLDPRRVLHRLPVGLHRRGPRRGGEHDLQLLTAGRVAGQVCQTPGIVIRCGDPLRVRSAPDRLGEARS